MSTTGNSFLICAKHITNKLKAQEEDWRPNCHKCVLTVVLTMCHFKCPKYCFLLIKMTNHDTAWQTISKTSLWCSHRHIITGTVWSWQKVAAVVVQWLVVHLIIELPLFFRHIPAQYLWSASGLYTSSNGSSQVLFAIIYQLVRPVTHFSSRAKRVASADGIMTGSSCLEKYKSSNHLSYGMVGLSHCK